MFFQRFNPEKKSLEEVQKIISGVNDMCNLVNEKIGGSIDSMEMYTMVLYKLNYDTKKLSLRDIHAIYFLVSTMFFESPPTLYSDDTMRVLSELKQKGSTLSILSNTAFIKGITLIELLKKLKIDTYFSFQMYSDEYSLSKPNKTFFLTMINAVNRIRIQNPVELTDIVHVGDNVINDVKGSINVGIEGFLINTEDENITDLLWRIKLIRI